MKDYLTLDSKLSDLLSIDLPRTHILKDIHSDITTAILGLKMYDSVKTEWITFIESIELFQFENFYRFWLENSEKDYKEYPVFHLEILFIYGLLLPYYLDYTKTDFTHLNQCTKSPNEKFRIIKTLKDDDFPHAFSLHHAHQLTKLLIEKCNHFNSHAYQNSLKTNNKDKEKRHWVRRAYNINARQFPTLNQTQLADKMLDWLEIENPKDEYNRDRIKNIVSDFKKGQMFHFTSWEIINMQNELLAYIRTMPTIK